jgi:uncharacterized protein
MTRIGLLSDTHSFLPDAVFKHFKDVDELWHAGDIGNMHVLKQLEDFKPTKAVWGNIDDAEIQKATKEDMVFTVEETKIYMTHIGGYPPKYNARVKPLIAAHKPDIFICGHSHILKVMRDPSFNLLHLNPGACGNQGWHKVKTLIRLEITGKVVSKLEVIEL